MLKILLGIIIGLPLWTIIIFIIFQIYLFNSNWFWLFLILYQVCEYV